MRRPYSDEIVKAAVQDYLSGMTTRQVGKKYGMCFSSVCGMVKRAGYTIRDANTRKRKYLINERFFEVIDSPAKAQILGFIYADGCIAMKSPTSGNLHIALATRDREYLEWIAAQTGSNRPIWDDEMIVLGKRRYKSVFTTSHPTIIKHLARLGVTPRKSLTIGFPTVGQVPDALMGAFIRGVFEGDGSIYIHGGRGGPTLRAAVSIAGSLPFNTGLKNFLKTKGIESTIQIRPTKQELPITVLVINLVPSVLKFRDLIYSDGGYRMERKHERFARFRAQYNEIDNGEQVTWELIKRKEFSDAHKAKLRAQMRASGMATARGAYLKSSCGQVHFTDAVRPFCREMNLHHGHARRVANGVALSHKGWTKPSEFEIEQAQTNGTLVTHLYRQPTAPVAPIAPIVPIAVPTAATAAA